MNLRVRSGLLNRGTAAERVMAAPLRALLGTICFPAALTPGRVAAWPPVCIFAKNV
jgi:hypothetical protein